MPVVTLPEELWRPLPHRADLGMAGPSAVVLDRAMPDTTKGGKHEPFVWHHGAEGTRLDMRGGTQALRARYLLAQGRTAALWNEFQLFPNWRPPA